MITLPTAAQNALASGNFGVRTLIDVYPDEGPQRFWDDFVEFQTDGPKAWETGVVYSPLGDLVTIGAYRYGQALTSKGLKITLDASRLDDPTWVLTQLEQSSWHQREVWIREMILDGRSSGFTPLAIVPVYAGLMDRMARVEDPSSGDLSLTIECESAARWFTRRTLRVRSDADQQEIWPGDKFFEFTPTAGTTEISWGSVPERATKNVQNPGGGSRGLVDSTGRSIY